MNSDSALNLTESEDTDINENEDYCDYLDENYVNLPDRVLRLKKLREKFRDVPKKPKYRKPKPPELIEALKIEKNIFKYNYKDDIFKTVTGIPHIGDNYNEQLKSYKLTLVLFYRKWSYGCLRLLPKYLKVAHFLKVKLSGQCTLALCELYTSKLIKQTNFYATPTIMLYVDDKFQKEYTDQREEADLKRFMLKAYNEFIFPYKKKLKHK